MYEIMKKFITICVLTAFLSFSSGCATYKTTGARLEDRGSLTAQTQEKDGITVIVKVLGAREISDVFQRNMLKRGIQPLYLIVKNNSTATCRLTRDNVQPRPLWAYQVADRCKFSTFWRVIWVSPFMISVILWPLLIPGIIGGMGAGNANNLMVQDYGRKEFSFDPIPAGQTLEGFIFQEKGRVPIGLSITGEGLVEPMEFMFMMSGIKALTDR